MTHPKLLLSLVSYSTQMCHKAKEYANIHKCQAVNGVLVLTKLADGSLLSYYTILAASNHISWTTYWPHSQLGSIYRLTKN